jgi:hypothetical protein
MGEQQPKKVKALEMLGQVVYFVQYFTLNIRM